MRLVPPLPEMPLLFNNEPASLPPVADPLLVLLPDCSIVHSLTMICEIDVVSSDEYAQGFRGSERAGDARGVFEKVGRRLCEG